MFSEYCFVFQFKLTTRDRQGTNMEMKLEKKQGVLGIEIADIEKDREVKIKRKRQS